MNEDKTLIDSVSEEPSLDFYMKNGFDQVEGWCSRQIIYFLSYLSDSQRNLEIKGGISEIGVHHGKLFIALHNLISKDEQSLAIDLFDNQKLNIDKSGKGDLSQFKNHLNNFSCYPDQAKIRIQDSTELTIKDIVDIESEFGKFRFFSIDGGHTAEHTVNDFRIAEQLLCNSGVMILDDYLNQDWPGVHEGVAYVFLQDRPRLVPFMIGAGKLLFTTISYQEKYFRLALDWAKNRRATDLIKPVKMYGYDVTSWQPR